MNFEPQKFFIGLVDFFSILMPGAMLVYLGRLEAPGLFGWQLSSLEGRTEGWMVFLFASYLFGHFVFLLGAILDEIIYDPFRMCTKPDKALELTRGNAWLADRLHQLAMSHWFFGKNPDLAVAQASLIKTRALTEAAPDAAINTFQWCKAWLSKMHPEGLVAVQRFEADSKFFRSLVVVLVVFMIGYLFGPHRILALACLGGLALALWRYIEMRFKSTQQAYWFVITLDAMNSAAAEGQAKSQHGTRMSG